MKHDDILFKIKHEDKKYADLCKGLVAMYLVLAVVYVLLIVLEIVRGAKFIEVVGGVCYLLSMLNFLLFFIYYNKRYRYADYSEPVLDMLKSALKRYMPFHPSGLALIPGLLLMDAGLTLNTFKYENVLLVQIIFVGIFTIAIIIGYFYWIFRYKPFTDQIKEMIKEIES
jgi:hypothetical protein